MRRTEQFCRPILGILFLLAVLKPVTTTFAAEYLNRPGFAGDSII